MAGMKAAVRHEASVCVIAVVGVAMFALSLCAVL
jgi:hypothetical protein